MHFIYGTVPVIICIQCGIVLVHGNVESRLINMGHPVYSFIFGKLLIS